MFVLIFRIQPSYYFLESLQKGIKNTRNLFFCFHYWLYWNFVSTYKPPLLSCTVTDLISDETNQHPQDTLCNYIGQNRQFHFLGPALPKNGFRFWNSKKKNVEIRISILEILCVPIFRPTQQLWLFWPKFAKKGI